MKYSMLFIVLSTVFWGAFGQNKISKGAYKIPDSINATAFYAEIKIIETAKKKKLIKGISANEASVTLGYEKEQKIIHFRFFDKTRADVAFGKDVYKYGMGNAWNYDWQYNITYPLLIATASDSAAHKTLYSGYIYLPNKKKWKLIATRSYDDTIAVKFIGTLNSNKSVTTYSNRWLQRSNGTWKALDSQTTKPPVLRPMPNIDSIAQQQMEEELLLSKLPKDSVTYEEGMFYQTLKEGTGPLVKITDTLTVHYRGSLYSDGSVFDETKDKPATFPLQRLIQGWQIGLVHCKVGGKMRLFIPSGSAYGIRTRSAEIPPNSILVFDVEVLDAKEKIAK
jgi:FKBP-type peptidyl-prolyl cis-trans isomerase FkpA